MSGHLEAFKNKTGWRHGDTQGVHCRPPPAEGGVQRVTRRETQDDCHLIANSEYSTCLCVFWRNKRDGGNNCGGRGEGEFTGHHTGVAPLQVPLTASLTHTSSHKAKLSTHKNAQTQAGLFLCCFFLFALAFLCKSEKMFKQCRLAGRNK